jgi:hypothetical protein
MGYKKALCIFSITYVLWSLFFMLPSYYKNNMEKTEIMNTLIVSIMILIAILNGFGSAITWVT